MDAQCPTGQLCDSDAGQCFQVTCTTLRDCQTGEVCSRGSCLPDINADRDQDGIPDAQDLCPDTPSSQDGDNDGDGLGDLCDNDDDNDAIPDTQDTCPRISNPDQADADGNGIGNLCDPDVRGTTLRGTLSVSERAPQDFTQARIILAGRETPVIPNPDGSFLFEEALQTAGSYLVEVRWGGFLPLFRAIETDASRPEIDLGTLALTWEGDLAENAVTMRGRVSLQNRAQSDGILVEAFLRDEPVGNTITNAQGEFTLRANPADHRLVFSKAAFQDVELVVAWNAENARFEVDGVDLRLFSDITLAPDESASVQGTLTSTLPTPIWSSSTIVRLLQGEEVWSTDVLADGSFSINALQPGIYTLEVIAPGHIPARRIVSLSSNTDTALPNILLTPENESGENAVNIRARVLLGDRFEEANHAGTVVRARVDGFLFATTITDTSGVFTFPALRVNTTLEFSQEGFLDSSVEIEWDQVANTFLFNTAPIENTTVLKTLQRAPLSDRDRDGIIDTLDNCLDNFNPNQLDTDADNIGDTCDPDIDNDTLPNASDNCPNIANPTQEDENGDGLGVACFGGLFEHPFSIGCGVTNQRLNTIGRPDQTRATCGGAGSGEVVWRVVMREDNSLSFHVRAEHAVVLYVLDDEGRQVACIANNTLSLQNESDAQPGDIIVPPGTYFIVVDGFNGPNSAGPIDVFAVNSACEPSFVETTHLDVGVEIPRVVIAEDFNNDTYMDLALLKYNNIERSEGPVELVIYHGDADGSYELVQTFFAGNDSSSLTLGDLNQDGFPDLVTEGGYSGRIRTYLGNDEGNFTEGPTTDIFFGAPVHSVQNDFDSDGVPDLAIANITGDVAHVFLGNGDGSFREAARLDAGDGPLFVQSADFDQDGAADLVTLNINSEDIALFYGRGDGTFDNPTSLPVNTGRGLSVGDVNFDGYPDIAFGIRILFNQGDRSFGLLQNYRDLPDNIAEPLVVDLNKDLIPDIVSWGFNPPSVLQHTSHANAQFSATRQSILTSFDDVDRFLSPSTTYDANRDGSLDIIVPMGDFGDFFSGTLDGRVSILESTPTTATLAPTNTFLPFAPQRSRLGSLTQDGPETLVFVDIDSNTVRFRQPNAEGDFTTLPPIDTGFDALNPISEVMIVDSNAQEPEIVLLTRPSLGGDSFSTLFVFTRNAEGHYTQTRSQALPEIVNIAEPADLNQDGLTDLLILFGTGTYTSYLSDGTQWSPEHTFTEHPNPDAIHAALLHDDTASSVLIVESSRIDIFSSSEGESYTQRTSLEGPSSLSGVVVADINDDSIPDVIAARTLSFRPQGITFWLGRSDGTFEDPRNLEHSVDTESGLERSHILGADINNDGLDDIIVLNGEASLFFVHMQDPNFGLLPSVTLPICTQQTEAFVAFSPSIFTRGGNAEIFSVDLAANRICSTRSTPSNTLLPGSSLAKSQLPPCPPQTIRLGHEETLTTLPMEDCSIQRLELEPDTGDLYEGIYLDMKTTIKDLRITRPALHPEGPWKPEYIPSLARFRQVPLSSIQTISGPPELTSTLLHINPETPNPFADTSNDCTDLDDYTTHPDLQCILSPTQTITTRLDLDGNPHDAFLLQGPLRGAFARGQAIVLTVQGEVDNLSADIRPHRALSPGTLAQREGEDTLVVHYPITDPFNLRAFSAHVHAIDPDHPTPQYTLSWALIEVRETACNNDLDDDGDGFIDCEDTECSLDPVCAP